MQGPYQLSEELILTFELLSSLLLSVPLSIALFLSLVSLFSRSSVAYEYMEYYCYNSLNYQKHRYNYLLLVIKREKSDCLRAPFDITQIQTTS